MKKIVIIDNYDSFTYNLVQIVEEALGERPAIFRNDAKELDDLSSYDGIIISPGPGIPSEAGKLMDCIKFYRESHELLGICLGHQAIAEAFGAELINLSKVYHGIPDEVSQLNTSKLLANIPQKFTAGRYHSWAINEKSLPAELEVNCKTTDGCVMGFQHQSLPIYGFQFHPESVLTPEGETIIKNFLN